MTTGTNWQERIAPDEDERFEGFARMVAAVQARADRRWGAGRGLHRKPIAGVRATFTVAGDVPAHLAVGPFASPRAYTAWVRLSNGSPRVMPDTVPDVRGVAVKLLGVDGPKVLGDHRTQDFLLIPRRVQVFPTPDEFVRFMEVSGAGPQWSLGWRLARAFGPLRALAVARGVLATVRPPVGSFAAQSWYSACPIRWGDTAARYALAPVAAADGAPPTTPDGYTTDVASRLRAGPVRFDFRVQTWHSEARTPIEDASVDWTDDVSPFTTIGRLEIPAQDLDAPEARALALRIEQAAFDPWHACEVLRPLGAMMRARKVAYYATQQARGAAPEPAGDDG